MSRELLAALREQVRRIERPAAAAHGVSPFGVAAIDRALPGGGLARGALHEILGMGGDEEDGALAAAFAAVILGRLGTAAAEHPGMTGEDRGGGRPGPPLASDWADIVLWCLPRPDLYGPGLAAQGLDPARLVLVRASRDGEILWAMEEGLRAAGIAAVVGEVGRLPAVASRRLQLAAERSGVTVLVLRRWRDGGEAARERNLPSAATTRWRIAALPSRPIAIPSPASGGGSGWGLGVGVTRWRVELLRCRGGEPACWDVEAGEGQGAEGRGAERQVADATNSLSLAAALADRPAAAFRDAAPDAAHDAVSHRSRRAG